MIPGITDKLGLGVQNKAGQRLMEFCRENTLVIAKTHFPQEMTLCVISNSAVLCIELCFGSEMGDFSAFYPVLLVALKPLIDQLAAVGKAV